MSKEPQDRFLVFKSRIPFDASSDMELATSKLFKSRKKAWAWARKNVGVGYDKEIRRVDAGTNPEEISP